MEQDTVDEFPEKTGVALAIASAVSFPGMRNRGLHPHVLSSCHGKRLCSRRHCFPLHSSWGAQGHPFEEEELNLDDLEVVWLALLRIVVLVIGYCFFLAARC